MVHVPEVRSKTVTHFPVDLSVDFEPHLPPFVVTCTVLSMTLLGHSNAKQMTIFPLTLLLYFSEVSLIGSNTRCVFGKLLHTPGYFHWSHNSIASRNSTVAMVKYCCEDELVLLNGQILLHGALVSNRLDIRGLFIWLGLRVTCYLNVLLVLLRLAIAFERAFFLGLPIGR